MKNKVKEIMATVFEVSVDDISENSSSATINNWDSLKHILLVSSLEEEFSVRFTDEQIGDMLNFNLIMHILNENGVN